MEIWLFIIFCGFPFCCFVLWLIYTNWPQEKKVDPLAYWRPVDMQLSQMAETQKFYAQAQLDEAIQQTSIMLQNMPDQIQRQWEECTPPSLLGWLCKW